MKKIVCLLLALIMCASALSLMAVAEDEKYELLGGAIGTPKATYTLTHIKHVHVASLPNSYPTKAAGGFTLVDADVDVEITTFAPAFTDKQSPVALYVMNFMEADDCTDAQNIDCINDLLDQGFVVVVADFMNDARACLPNLDWFVQHLRQNIEDYMAGVSASSKDIYVITEGYGIARHVVYYDYENNAPEGTLEDIVNVFKNPKSSFRKSKTVPAKYAVAENITDVYHCVKPNTAPVDLELMLDIVYPKYRDNAAVVMVASSSGTNMDVVNKDARPMDVSALLRGYVAVVYEHPYVPMARDDHYSYYDSYSYMHTLGHKSHAAAARCVRYYADTFGYSKENYASMGISKMAMAGVLTNPAIESVPDRSGFYNGLKRDDVYGEQPYLAYEDGTPIKSSVDISYHAMGYGSKFANTWLSEGCAPAILMCGLYDEYDAWGYWDKLQGQYEELGIVYYPFSSYNLGHDYPFGVCDFYGYERWSVFFDIVSYYLEGNRPSYIAIASIYNGEVVGDVKVIDRVITSGNDYVSSTQVKGDEIFVQFIAPVTEASITEAMKLYDEDGNEVEGTLRGMCGGLKWYFEPAQKLSAGSYTLKVADNTVKSIMNGLVTQTGGEWAFTIK